MLLATLTTRSVAETGASAIFGPQKGADAETVAYLDNALHRYGNLLQRDLGRDVMEVPGAGAAGGLGAGLMAFTDAQLRPGADIVIDALDLDTRLEGASLVIVGEGQTDRSTVFNKAPVAVAQRAKAPRHSDRCHIRESGRRLPTGA